MESETTLTLDESGCSYNVLVTRKASGGLGLLSAYTESVKKPNNINRRVLFAGFLAAPTAASATPSVDPIEQVRRDGDALARSLAALRGGEWTVQFGGTFALIRQEPVVRQPEYL